MFRLPCVCSLLLLLAAPSSIHAQTADGGLDGEVTDPQGQAMSGVVLVLKSVTAPGARTTTDDDGRYVLLNLPPGSYTLTATHGGFTDAVHTVVIRAGQRSHLSFRMAVGSVDETVNVVHEAPLLETLRGGHAVNVGGDLLRAMPLLERREWFGALTLAPGVTTSDWANNEKLFYVHGADMAANVVQIDGADVTPTIGGSVRFIGLNTDAVDDMQIRTAGVDASAPLGLGGIINIAAASGSNALKGSATLVAQPRAWNASNTPGGTSNTAKQRQVDASVGAPVVKDRLWAFGAYRYIDYENGLSRTPQQLAALTALVPGFTPFDNTSRAHLWFGKLTAQLSTAHQLSGFYQYDDSPVTSASDGARAAPATRNSGGTGSSVRLNSVWSNRLTTRVGVNYNDKGTHGRDSGATEPAQRVYQTTRLSAGRILGTTRVMDRGAPESAWYEQENAKITLSLDSTLLATAGGAHEIQTGLYLQPRIQLRLQDYYTNGGFAYEEAVLRQPGVFEAGVVPFHRIIYNGETLTRLDRRGQDYAAYVQDAWRPFARLTINAGVRIDRIVWTDQLFDVTSQTSTEIGPRFSVNYALTSEGRNIVKAHWVRVHDQPSSTSASVGTVTTGQRDLYDLDLDGTFETLFVSPATNAVTPGRTIDQDFHQPFIHEWGLGYAKQFSGALTANVDVVRRDFRDRPTLLETNRRYAGNVFTGYIDEAFNDIYQATNNRWNRPVYTSVELSVTKRTAHLQGVASYVRQWRHLAGTWQSDDPASFIQPTAFANDKGIGSATGSTSVPSDANSLSGTNMTPAETGSSQWQDHVVRLGATWSGPWAVMVGSHYTFQSGAWSGPIVTNLASPDPAFGPATITLANGRTVSNPLATTIRFAFPTRGDGQLRTPNLHVWNLRIGRRSSFGRVLLDTSLDLFNVTNNASDATFAFGTNQAFAANFGATQYRQLPRSGQVVLRASF